MEDEKSKPPRKRSTRSADGESAPRSRAGSHKDADDNAMPDKAPRKRASVASDGPTSDAAPKAPRKRASGGGEPTKRAAPRAKASEAVAQPPASNANDAALTTTSSTPHAALSTAAPGAAQAAVPRAPIANASSTAAANPAGKNAAAHDARDMRKSEKTFVPSFARVTTPAPRARSDVRPADASPRSTRFIEWICNLLPDRYRNRARNSLVLMRMDRPVGALLLLWPTWWALWFAANDFPPPGLLVIFTLGVFVMRSAGCVINDYADHEWLDANVERTAGRPMAAGRVTKKEALQLFAGLLAFAFVLVLFTNRLTIGLSFVGAALAAIYPFTKRVTHLAQVVLGAAFGWSIPMTFAAVTNSLPPLCWLLFLANILFSVIYDTQYAMVDRDEDLRVGAKSTAILFGDADRAIVGVLMATFVLAMGLAGTRAALHWPYFVGLAIATGLFVHQQWLMRDRSRAHCFAAFRNNNWTGFALWLGLMFALAIR